MKKNIWKFQKTNFTCGVAALRNCFLNYNINISEERLRELTKTTSLGAGAEDITKAAIKCGFNAKIRMSSSKDVFGRKLLKSLKAGHTCVVLVEDTTHWVAAVAYQKRKIKMIDSSFYGTLTKIEKDFTLKEVTHWAHNFNKFTGLDYYLWIDISPK